MFGMNPATLWSIVFLIFSNMVCGIFWLAASTRAEAHKERAEACAAKHQAFTDQVEAYGRAAELRAKSITAENERVANETAKSWRARLAGVRADADQRLRDYAARYPAGGGVPAAGEDRPGTAGADADAIPAPGQLAADCAETTLTANALQEFVERTAKGIQ